MKVIYIFYAFLVLALSVLLVFTACRGQQDAALLTQESSTVTDNGNAAEDQMTEAASVTKAADAAAETEAADETAAETETASETTLPAAPTDTAQIVQLYNDAINRAVDSTASFTKTRRTDDVTIECSKALKPFLEENKDRVYEFMGIEAQVPTRVTPQEESYDHYLQHSRLTAADVDSAKCTVDGDGNYQIELHIKDGKSFASKDGATCTAPLDKCGIAVGEEDKSYWDHKTAANLYAGLDEPPVNVLNAQANEQYDNAVVKAVVQPDGTPVRVDIRFHVRIHLSAIRAFYGNGSGTTTVVYDRFSVPKA